MWLLKKPQNIPPIDVIPMPITTVDQVVSNLKHNAPRQIAGITEAMSVAIFRAHVVDNFPLPRSASNVLLSVMLKNHIVKNGIDDANAFFLMSISCT